MVLRMSFTGNVLLEDKSYQIEPLKNSSVMFANINWFQVHSAIRASLYSSWYRSLTRDWLSLMRLYTWHSVIPPAVLISHEPGASKPFPFIPVSPCCPGNVRWAALITWPQPWFIPLASVSRRRKCPLTKSLEGFAVHASSAERCCFVVCKDY